MTTYRYEMQLEKASGNVTCAKCSFSGNSDAVDEDAMWNWLRCWMILPGVWLARIRCGRQGWKERRFESK